MDSISETRLPSCADRMLLLRTRIFASMQIAHSSCATRTTLRTVRSPWRFKVCATIRVIRSSTSVSCWDRLCVCLIHGANSTCCLLCVDIKLTNDSPLECRGRTSSQEFQVHLASVYHKVLQVPLPSWHSSIDTLTVWKRTKTSIMDNSIYAFIPVHERLDLVEVCPSTRFLLEESSADTKEAPKSTKKQKSVDSESAKSSPKRRKQ